MRDLPTRNPARFTEAAIGMLGTWSQVELGQSNGASCSSGHCTVQPQREPCCLGGGGEERQAPRGQARLEFIKPTPLLSVGSWPILQGVVSTKGSGVLLVEACDSAVRPCGCGPEGSSYSLQRIGQHTP